MNKKRYVEEATAVKKLTDQLTFKKSETQNPPQMQSKSNNQDALAVLASILGLILIVVGVLTTWLIK
ncbi:MAG: hypothetical protein LCH34_03445 [Firmicutes bacterium]|nr:hypothetical protein [Bacillota bacterium]